MKKKLTAAILTAALAAAMSVPALAGQWLSDSNGWWYRNDDGTFLANTWYWLDGNNDGIQECYYFDPHGYSLANTNTPDGYTVNASGAWTIDGVVQTRQVSTQASQQTQNQQQTSSVQAVKLEDLDPVAKAHWNKEENKRTIQNELWSKAMSLYGLGYVEYYTGGQYNTFSATIAPMKGYEKNSDYTLEVYGDDDNLLDSFDINYKTKPTNISVDISGQDYIKLTFLINDGYAGSWVLFKNAQFK